MTDYVNNMEPTSQEASYNQEDEANDDGYAAMLNRYICKVTPRTLLNQTKLISKCCEPLVHNGEAMEHVVVSTPRDQGAVTDKETQDEEDSRDCASTDVLNEDEMSDDVTVEMEPEQRVVMREVEPEVAHDNLPSIEIGLREVAFKDHSMTPKSAKSKSISFHYDQKDPELTERAVLIFVENSISLAKRAVADNKAIFADKLIRGMLKKIREIYGSNEQGAVEDAKRHPFVHMMDELPEDTPSAVKDALAVIADDKMFITCLAEMILVMDLIDKFNMSCMKTHIQNYRQRILAKLWPSAIETAQYELGKTDANMGTMNTIDVDILQKEVDKEHQDGQVNPPVVERIATKQVRMSPVTANEERKTARKSSKYLAYATKFISRKNTMFGQHFSKNKVRTVDGWVKEPYRTLETYYRFEDNGSVSVKVRGKLSTDLMRVLCIINETELSSEWVPFLKEASNLHVFSRTTKIFQQKYEYPVVGLKNTSVFGIAINVLDESGCLILGCRGPPETKADVELLTNVLQAGGLEDVTPFVAFEENKCKLWGQEIQPIQAKVRQKSADLCFLLYPMQNHTLVELYANITPEVRLVPSRVVTYIIKKVVVTIFKKIAQISKTFDETPFATRMEQNTEFYEWIAKLIGDYTGKGERPNCNISICTYDPNCNDA